MILYSKIHKLLQEEMDKKGYSLRILADKIGVNYMVLWRLLQAKSNEDTFKDGKNRKGLVIANIGMDVVDKLCAYFEVQIQDLLIFKK